MKAKEELTAREATIIADDLLLLMERNFAAGIEAWEKAPPLSWAIVKAYFEEPTSAADQAFNPRRVARIEKLRHRFHEYLRSRTPVGRN